MKTKILFIALLIASASIINGQTVVVVNPDGTHTIAYIPEGGSGIGIAVNPDGTHTVVQQIGGIAIPIGGTGMFKAAPNTDLFERRQIFWNTSKKKKVVQTKSPHMLIIDPLGNHMLAVYHAQAAMLLIPSCTL